jgi:hypothetical protein
MELVNGYVKSDCDIYQLSDIHEGNSLASLNDVRAVVDEIASKDNAYCIFGGDEIDAIIVDDIRYKPESCTEPIPLLQCKNVVKMFAPIKDKILLWLYGNHPMKLWRFGNLTKDIILKDLGIQHVYGGFSSKLSLYDEQKKLMFKVYATHGRRIINSGAGDPKMQVQNKLRVLRRHLEQMAGDALVMQKSHAHQLLVSEPERQLYLVDDGKRIRQRYTVSSETGRDYIPPYLRWYVCTGSFLKTFGIGVVSYSEALEYSPVEIGYTVMEIRNRQLVNIRKVVV